MVLTQEIDDDGDGNITFTEFMSHDVLHLLTDAVHKTNQAKNEKLESKEARTHVNVGRIVEVAKAKTERSRLAYALLRYIVFLFVYSFVIIQQRAPQNAMDMRAALKNYFVGAQYRVPNGYELKSWLDIKTHEELWDWTEILFADFYHLETYYNGDPFNLADRGSILQHMRMTSGFRIVQRRSRNGTCSSYPVYSDFADACYGDTFVNGQFGPAYDTAAFKGATTGTMYKHTQTSWTDFGFIENFDRNRSATAKHLKRLRSDLWVNNGTRFFKIDLVAYCANAGQFAFMEFKVDMRTSGSLLPSVDVSCRRYSFYQTSDDWLRLTLEIVVLISFVCYVYAFGLKMAASGRSILEKLAFLKTAWHFLEFVHLLLLLGGLIMWIYLVVDPTISKLVITQDAILMDGRSVSFTDTAALVEAYFALNGVNMLIGMMLVIKFLRMNSHLGQLTDTFVLMMEGLTNFMLVLLLVLVVFTSIGMMLFGSKLSIFADPIRALDTTVGFVMGFSDTQLLFDTDAPAALIFYVPFVFVMIFFILPLTIAIIMDGYTDMQNSALYHETSSLSGLVNISVFTQAAHGLQRQMQLLVKDKRNHPRLRFPDLEHLLSLFDADEFRDTPVMTYAEVQNKVAQRNIPEGLLIDLLDKYDAFQHDPQWRHLSGQDNGDLDLQAVARAEDGDAILLGQVLGELENHVESIIADQV